VCAEIKVVNGAENVGYFHRYNILIDGDDILKSPVGPLVKAVYDRFQIGTENIYPLTTLPILGVPR
jgi:hypothetical protein